MNCYKRPHFMKRLCMTRIGLTKDKVEASLEYLGFIRSGIDVFCGYQDYEELKRYRQTYLVQVCD